MSSGCAKVGLDEGPGPFLVGSIPSNLALCDDDRELRLGHCRRLGLAVGDSIWTNHARHGKGGLTRSRERWGYAD